MSRADGRCRASSFWMNTMGMKSQPSRQAAMNRKTTICMKPFKFIKKVSPIIFCR